MKNSSHMLRVPVLLALTLSAGCCYTANVTGPWDFFSNSVRNLGQEPVRGVDDVYHVHRIKMLADKAWEEASEECPDGTYSSDYANGFKTGFVDYLEAGGTGHPPAVPPFCRQLSCYRNPEGLAATREWYAGFRHGAEVARRSGLRSLFVVPVSSVPGRPTIHASDRDWNSPRTPGHSSAHGVPPAGQLPPPELVRPPAEEGAPPSKE